MTKKERSDIARKLGRPGRKKRAEQYAAMTAEERSAFMKTVAARRHPAKPAAPNVVKSHYIELPQVVENGGSISR